MAVAGVWPQAGISSSSVISLLDDSWCFASFFNPSRVPASPKIAGNSAHAKFTVFKPLVGSEESSQNTSAGAPTVRDTGECSPATSRGDHGCQPSGSGNDRASEGAAKIRWSHSVGEAEFRKVFENFDDNADGLVSGDELRRFMSVWGIDASEAEALSIITSVDYNRKGGIDFDEFYSLYQTKLVGPGYLKEEAEDSRVLSAAFQMFDKNQDGFISAQELQAILVSLGQSAGRSLKQCQRMIANVDRDGNGLCDIHEFEEMMSSRQL